MSTWHKMHSNSMLTMNVGKKRKTFDRRVDRVNRINPNYCTNIHNAPTYVFDKYVSTFCLFAWLTSCFVPQFCVSSPNEYRTLTLVGSLFHGKHTALNNHKLNERMKQDRAHTAHWTRWKNFSFSFRNLHVSRIFHKPYLDIVDVYLFIHLFIYKILVFA